MSAPLPCTIARYCAVEGQYCNRDVDVTPFPSCFLAYPSSTHWAQFAEELRSELNARGISATTWQDIISGGPLYPKICDAIHSNSFALCELTDLNLNVLFEVGYTLASGRDAVILLDKTRASRPLPILRTKEHCYYETRDDIHEWLAKYIAKVAPDVAVYSPASVMQMNGIAEAVEKPATLYYLRPRNSTQVLKAVGEQLSKSPFKVTASDPLDTTFDDFYHQARQIKESQLIVGVLITNKTKDALQVNAPVAMLLGLAVGLGKRVLVLQEQPNDTLLDLGSMLRTFQGERTARSIVQQWIKSESESFTHAAGTIMRTAQHQIEISRVRDLFLGQPDAMVDYNLMDYFIKTAPYRQALNGVKQIFVGRKGAGKSATFRALQDELGRRQSAIVVHIAPTDFQFEQLTGFLADRFSALHPAFVYQTFWKYVLLTEVLKIIADRYSHFLQSAGQAHVSRLLSHLSESDDLIQLDFASRAIDALTALERMHGGRSDTETQQELEKTLHRARMTSVEKDLQKLAIDYPIYILVDDVDKHWNPKYEASVRLLLGLVNETAQLYARFKGGLNVALFLRQDIFEVLRRVDEE